MTYTFNMISLVVYILEILFGVYISTNSMSLNSKNLYQYCDFDF